MALNKKRRVFIEEYLKCWNLTEAARRAGYKHPNVKGSQLVKVSEVADAIQERIAEKCMSADEVLIRLAEQARGDISEFINDFGGIDWEAVSQRGYLIKKISHNKGKNSSIELYDSQSALALIGKHHKLFVDRQEITGKDGTPITIKVIYHDATDGNPEEGA